MPPTRELHVDQVLTDVSVGYRNAQFIGLEIFKPVPVERQSDKYLVMGKEHYDVRPDRVSPTGVANEIEWTLSHDTYYCEGHALRHPIADEARGNNSTGLDLDIRATELVTNGVLLNLERATALKVGDLNTYLPSQRVTLAGTSQWNDYTNSNPIGDVETAKEAVRQQIGIRPNTLVIGPAVYAQLKWHTKLVDKYKYTQKGVVTQDMLKELFEVDRVLVGEALYNSARPGQATTLADVWGKFAAVLYVPEQPGQLTPAFGYTYEWNYDGRAPKGGVIVYKYHLPERRSDMVEVFKYYDQKTVAQAGGYLLNAAVA